MIKVQYLSYNKLSTGRLYLKNAYDSDVPFSFSYKMDENITFLWKIIYLYKGKWMNKTYTQSEIILVDRHTVLCNYSVIFQVLAFQKVINKHQQIALSQFRAYVTLTFRR